jgi:hypothetical protein
MEDERNDGQNNVRHEKDGKYVFQSLSLSETTALSGRKKF